MNMEGTKHEKVVILVLAYVVGFTSGFIAFGVATPDLETVTPVAVVESITSEVPMEEVATDLPVIEEQAVTLSDDNAKDYIEPMYPQGTHVYYQNGRLFVSIDGNVNLLSIEKNRMAANVTDLFSSQGSHVAVPHYAISDDNKFVYYCEQQSSQDTCVSFVYDIANQTVQYVVENGQKLVLAASDAKKAVWSNATLLVGNGASISPETPWKVATR